MLNAGLSEYSDTPLFLRHIKENLCENPQWEHFLTNMAILPSSMLRKSINEMEHRMIDFATSRATFRTQWTDQSNWQFPSSVPSSPHNSSKDLRTKAAEPVETKRSVQVGETAAQTGTTLRGSQAVARTVTFLNPERRSISTNPVISRIISISTNPKEHPTNSVTPLLQMNWNLMSKYAPMKPW